MEMKRKLCEINVKFSGINAFRKLKIGNVNYWSWLKLILVKVFKKIHIFKRFWYKFPVKNIGGRIKSRRRRTTSRNDEAIRGKLCLNSVTSGRW